MGKECTVFQGYWCSGQCFATYDIFNENGWGRSLHFLAAWFLVITGLFYFITGIFTRHFRNHLWPRAKEFSLRLFWRDVIKPHANANSIGNPWSAVWLTAKIQLHRCDILSDAGYYTDGHDDVTRYYSSLSIPLKNIFWSSIGSYHSLLCFHFAATFFYRTRCDGDQVWIQKANTSHDHRKIIWKRKKSLPGARQLSQD